jgi:hypothetical protein
VFSVEQSDQKVLLKVFLSVQASRVDVPLPDPVNSVGWAVVVSVVEPVVELELEELELDELELEDDELACVVVVLVVLVVVGIDTWPAYIWPSLISSSTKLKVNWLCSFSPVTYF